MLYLTTGKLKNVTAHTVFTENPEDVNFFLDKTNIKVIQLNQLKSLEVIIKNIKPW